MAAIAPDATASGEHPAGSGPFVADVGAGHRRADRGPRARHGPAHRDGPGLHAGRRRARRRRGQGRPAGLGRDELPGAGADPPPRRRDLRGQPRRVRHVDAARDRRLAQQDAPRVELRLPRDPRRGDAAVAAVRLADAVRGEGPAVDGPAGPGRGRRGDHAVELAERAGDARRRAGPGARQRRRPQAGPPDAGHRRGDVRGGLPRGRSARGAAADRRRRRRRRRGARDRPEHPGRLVHRFHRRRATGRRSWPAGCSRRSRSSSVATTRSSSSTTPTSTRPRAAGAFSSFQFQGQVCFAAGATSSTRAWPTDYTDALSEKAKRLRTGRSVPRGRPARADRQREAAPPRRRTSSSAR